MVALSATVVSCALLSLGHVMIGGKRCNPQISTRIALLTPSQPSRPIQSLRSQPKLFTLLHDYDADAPSGASTMAKAVALGALVLQNTGLAVAMRMSRIGIDPSLAYIPSTAVVVSEAMKVLVAVVMRWWERRQSRPTETWSDEMHKLYTPAYDIGIIGLSSALYVIQNNLQYVATSSLPAAVYQVSVQMKTISAAVASYFAFNRHLTTLQWLSILLLTIGTILVQLSAHTTKVVLHVNMRLGLTAVGLSCITSALAGVTQEEALKNGKLTLWARNTQICIISLALALITALKDGKRIMEVGFFHGYSPLVWGVIMLQALGGLLVSIVVKQTNTVVKGFTSSGAILLSCFISLFLLKDVHLTRGLIAGASLVCLATLGYGRKYLRRRPLPLKKLQHATTRSMFGEEDDEKTLSSPACTPC
eukprot:gene7849-8662_t